jgi:putative peptidoglycan lipid II flippase
MEGDRRSLLKSAGIVGFFTLISRVAGLVRDVLTSRAFGTGTAFSAFELAFRVPNLFRALFAEGALNAAFTPVYKEYLEKRNEERTTKLLNATTTLLSLVLAVVVVLGYVVSLGLRYFFTVSGKPGALFCNLLDIMMPYLLLVCLTGFLSAVQNTLEQFAVPALASTLLNLCWIAGILSLSLWPNIGIYAVAIAVLVSGFLQVGMQGLSLHMKGVRFRFDPDWRDPDILKILRLMLPVVIGLGVTQINFLIDGVIAWKLVPTNQDVGGGNSVLFYGNRLMQFPLGVVGIAMGTAILPYLSKHAARGDKASFLASMNQAIRTTLFISIPATVLMIALARPIVELVYMRGQFTEVSAQRTIWVLIAYTAGLWAYCALQVLTRAFYSLQDTKTPMKIAFLRVAVNLTLNLTLVWFLWEAGIALATAITASLNVFIFMYILRGRMGRIGARVVLVSALKICAVTALMCLAAMIALHLLPSAQAASGLKWRLIRVLLPMSVGGVVFLAACMATRLAEWQEFLEAFWRRKEKLVRKSGTPEGAKP